MTDVLMHESRRLELPLETMIDVLVEFESMRKRWPERSELEDARLEPAGIVLAIKSQGSERLERTYSLAIIAAAIIQYCAKMRVPIPRNASKSVVITPAGVAMTLEGTLFLQRQHQELPAGFLARSNSRPATPASMPESSAPVASQPESESAAVLQPDGALAEEPSDGLGSAPPATAPESA